MTVARSVSLTTGAFGVSSGLRRPDPMRASGKSESKRKTPNHALQRTPGFGVQLPSAALVRPAQSRAVLPAMKPGTARAFASRRRAAMRVPGPESLSLGSLGVASRTMKPRSIPSCWRVLRLFLLVGFSLLSIAANAADRIVSAEAALDRFRAACDNEIKRAVSPETMARINGVRGRSSLVITRKAPADFADLKDPKTLADVSRFDLYGSRGSITKSSSNTWVLDYTDMKGIVVYLDAASGSVLCVAFSPEG